MLSELITGLLHIVPLSFTDTTAVFKIHTPVPRGGVAVAGSPSYVIGNSGRSEGKGDWHSAGDESSDGGADRGDAGDNLGAENGIGIDELVFNGIAEAIKGLCYPILLGIPDFTAKRVFQTVPEVASTPTPLASATHNDGLRMSGLLY